MSSFDDESSVIGEDQAIKDSNPSIYGPVEGAILTSARIAVEGQAHAGRNVRAVTPGQEDQLSTKMQTDGTGHYKVIYLADVDPGKTEIQVLQWVQMPDSVRRSPIRTVYYMPKAIFTGPPIGAVVPKKTTFSGRNAAPGAIMEIVQAGNERVVYASITVAPDGTFSGVNTLDLLPGQFIFSGRYSIDGKVSPWAADSLVNVQ